MKAPDTLIRVSRASVLSKTFDVTEEYLREHLTGKELEAALLELPTEDEREWRAIFVSEAPELQRLRRKISVCIDAEIMEMSEDCVVYEFNGNTYRLDTPRNAFRICSALEKGTLEAVAEMCAQKCVKMNGRVISDIRKDGIMPVDELQLLVRIAAKFFFQIFLG